MTLPSQPAPAESKWLFVIAIIGLCAAAGLLIFGSDRGIDLTDDIFYVIWLDNPAAYSLSYQPFGYLLNPVYELLGRSLAAIRIAGVLALLAGGAIFGFFCDRFYRAAYPAHYLAGGSLIPLAALVALSYYVHWLATPNYNLLGNLGAFVAGAGLVGWMTPVPPGSRRLDRLASLLVGLGGYISFFGKPPLAALELAAAAAIAVVQVRKIPLSTLGERIAISATVAAILVVATIARVSNPLEFLPAILETQRIVNLEISLDRLPLKFIREIYYGPPIFLLSLLSFLLVLALPDMTSQDTRRLRVMLLLVLAGTFLLFFHRAAYAIPAGDTPPLTGLTVVSAMLVWMGVSQLRRKLPIGALAIPIALALAPFAVVLGTFNNTPWQLNMHMGFALLSACVLARLTMSPRNGAWLQAMIAAFVLLLVLAAAFKPHEYPSSIFRQSEPLRIPLAQQPIRVDRTTRRYALDLDRIAKSNGLRPGSPVLDLTGAGPGSAILLGGRAPVLPWITHVTPHWADIVWDRMSADERREAWIVGPIHSVFAETRVARLLARNANRYRCAGVTEMKAWDRLRQVTIWKPAAPGEPASGSCPAGLRLDQDMYRRDQRL